MKTFSIIACYVLAIGTVLWDKLKAYRRRAQKIVVYVTGF